MVHVAASFIAESDELAVGVDVCRTGRTKFCPTRLVAAKGWADPDTPSHVTGSSTPTTVVSKAPNLNTARRLERLDSAWDKGSSEVSVAPSVAPEPGSGVVSNPSRRNRTPLTEKEVEAIRTARAEGERVVSIAERFGIHRCTVLHYTKTAQSR